MRKIGSTAVLWLCLSMLTMSVSFAQSIPPGYSYLLNDEGIQLSFNGQSVFEAERAAWDPVFMANGPIDMTGNGYPPNLAVIERTARSAAKFSFLELSETGAKILFEDVDRPEMLDVYRGLSDTQAKSLEAGKSILKPNDQLRPFPKGSRRDGAKISISPLNNAQNNKVHEIPSRNTAKSDELLLTNGRWVYHPGSRDEGFSAYLGWKDPDISKSSFTEIKFRCPANGDDIWSSR